MITLSKINPPKKFLGYFVGSSDQVVPTSGEVEQYARFPGLFRAGDGLSTTQPDFNDFFNDGGEEEDSREAEASVGREEYPTGSQSLRGVDPTTGFRRGEEPLRRDYEFLRQWENRQRGGRSFDSRRDDSSTASNSKYGDGSNYYRGGGRDVHSPMGDGFQVGTQIYVVG